MEMNPYAAPEVDVMPPLPATTAAEEIRRRHINTEATIKSIGTLYYIGAVVGVLAGAAQLITMEAGQEAVTVVIALILLSTGLGQGVLAHGLRRLKSWTRIPTIVFSAIGLLGFPIGTIISIYFLVTLAGEKGRTVMTPAYQEIIQATPHIKRKTSVAVWVLLALVVLVLVGLIASAFFQD